MADFADGAVAVVGSDVDDNGDATRAVAFTRDFLVAEAFDLTGAALDGPLDVVLRHVLRFCGQDGGAQPGVGVRVTAALGSNSDFLEQAGEYLAALGIERAFFVLDCGPFGMAGHKTS